MTYSIACGALLALLPIHTPAPGSRAQDAPAAAVQDVAAEYVALSEEFERAQNDFYAKYRELAQSFDDSTASAEEKKAFGERVEKFVAENDPSSKFVVRFEALGSRAKGSETAFDCWMQVLQLDSGKPTEGVEKPATRALAALVADHLQSERMGELAASFRYGAPVPHKPALDALRKIKDASPHRAVKAAASLALAFELGGERAEGQDKAKARTELISLQSNFADVKNPRGESYAEIADSFLFELDHLQLEMQAPDFAALDENGGSFKLSDYKGKVVMVDFWGFW